MYQIKERLEKVEFLFLGVHVCLESNCTWLLDYFRKDYHHNHKNLSDIISASSVIHITMIGKNSHIVLIDSFDEKKLANNRKEAVNLLNNILLTNCIRKLARYNLIHAGAICYNGWASLFVGDSETGKTTLVLGMVKRGFRFLADSATLIDINTKNIPIFSTKIHIRDDSYFSNLLSRQVVRHCPKFGDKYIMCLEEIFKGPFDNSSSKLKWIFFLRPDKTKDNLPRIREIRPSQAFRKLLDFTLLDSEDTAEKIKGKLRIIEGTKCYELFKGGVERTLDLVETILKDRS